MDEYLRNDSAGRRVKSGGYERHLTSSPSSNPKLELSWFDAPPDCHGQAGATMAKKCTSS